MRGERVGAAARGHGEAGAVEDHVRRDQLLSEHVDAGPVLETGDVEGLRPDAAVGQRCHQRVDGSRLRALEDGAVEDDGGERLTGP